MVWGDTYMINKSQITTTMFDQSRAAKWPRLADKGCRICETTKAILHFLDSVGTNVVIHFFAAGW